MKTSKEQKFGMDYYSYKRGIKQGRLQALDDVKRIIEGFEYSVPQDTNGIHFIEDILLELKQSIAKLRKEGK